MFMERSWRREGELDSGSGREEPVLAPHTASLGRREMRTAPLPAGAGLTGCSGKPPARLRSRLLMAGKMRATLGVARLLTAFY